MIKILLVLSLVLSSVTYADTKLSVMGSLTYNTSDTDDLSSAIDEEPGTGFGLGLRALMGIDDQLHFRSGAGIVQKNFSWEIGNSDVDFSYTYLNVPLTLYWKAGPQVGLFAGTALNAKLDDECDASGNNFNCPDDETIVFPAIIGFDFSFSEKLGMEVSYEYGMTETLEDTKVSSAVISLLYHLD